jgi:hypothetical protein
MVLRFNSIPRNKNEVVLKNYQELFQSLDTLDQAVYRSLSASVADIVDMTGQIGQWPESILLEDAHVPPLAKGYLPAPADDLIWISYDGGTWVDYLGHDSSGRMSVSYILRLIDLHGSYHPHPHPGVDYDPNQAVAVQVWRYPVAQRPYPEERLPEAGWRWIVQEDDPLWRSGSSQKTGIED